MRKVAEDIYGYAYGTAALATSAVSLQELEDLKITVGFTSDERYSAGRRP